MFILALLDVSAHMGQQTQLGLTLLECAKSAVEQLLDGRRVEGLAQRDQYMLVTTSADAPPQQPDSSPDSHTRVVCGWHDSPRFLSALKAVQTVPAPPCDDCDGSYDAPRRPAHQYVSYLCAAITASLDLLNRYSRPNGIDNFGRGRILSYNEPAIMLLFTTDQCDELRWYDSEESPYVFVPSRLDASAYSAQPYRWDQRLFPIVLRLPLRQQGRQLQPASKLAAQAKAHTREPERFAHSFLSHYLAGAAQQTGGRSRVVASFAALLSHLDALSKQPCPNLFLHIDSQTVAGDNAAPVAGMDAVRLYRSEYTGVYVKSAGVWPLPESYLPEPHMHTLPEREPHPTLYFSCVSKRLPQTLLAELRSAPSTPTAASPAASSIPLSSAPPQLPPLESSIPFDSYTLDPSARVYKLLLADSANSCRHVSVQPSSATPPCGLLYANRETQRVHLVLLPYDFPTFLSYLSRIDTHLRSLPLTSSSSAALQHNPQLYSQFAAFLSKLPFYYAPAVQAALGRMHRLPRLDVKVDAAVAGGISAEVSDNMRRWKEEAGRAMKEEKEAREQKENGGRKEQQEDVRAQGKRKKRRREAMNGGSAGGHATAESKEDVKLRGRPASPEEAEIEWLLASNIAEERPLLPPPPPEQSRKTAEERRTARRQRGRVSVVDLFELEDDELDGARSEWRERAVRLMQPFPLLASLVPPPPPPLAPVELKLRPRLPPSASEPCHPIAAMGDFHAYLKSKPPPLREVVDDSDDGGSGAGLQAFGSPFRRHGRRELSANAGMDEDGEVEVNERDVAVLGGELQQSRGRGKWKPKPSLSEFVASAGRHRGEEKSEATEATNRSAEDGDTAMRE